MDNFNMISLNVRGIRGNKRFSIYKWLTENNFDVCLIQETYCTKDFAPIMKKVGMVIYFTVLQVQSIVKESVFCLEKVWSVRF